MNTSQRIKGKIKNGFAFLKNQKNILDEKFLPKPTKEEAAEIETLRREFDRLSSADSSEKMTGVWIAYCRKLQGYINKRDPRNFLNWDVIRYSMVHEPGKEEFAYLKSSSSWPVWKEALKESSAGNPKRYREMPETSGNMVHYAYSLAVLAETFHMRPREMKRIFEFGGGYGGMARLCFNLGFTGAYYMFDLPEFSALQKYYLRSTGLNIQKNSLVQKNVSLIDKPEFLEKNPLADIDILIGTWSLSETPLAFREKILSLVKEPKYYLISYQQTFRGIDNRRYFGDFEKSLPNYEWKHFQIAHLPGNYYLLGKKK